MTRKNRTMRQKKITAAAIIAQPLRIHRLAVEMREGADLAETPPAEETILAGAAPAAEADLVDLVDLVAADLADLVAVALAADLVVTRTLRPHHNL